MLEIVVTEKDLLLLLRTNTKHYTYTHELYAPKKYNTYTFQKRKDMHIKLY